MMRLLYILILIGPMILGNTLIAATITPSLEHRLADIREGDRIPVIVYFDEQVDLGRFTGGRATAGEMIVALQETAARSQARVLAHLHAFGLEAEVRSFWINNSIAFEATRPLLETLAGFSEVRSIEEDVTGRLPEPVIEPWPVPAATWNIEIVRADEVWEVFGLDGSGIVIGSLDTGFDPDHPAIADKWRGGDNSWFDFVNGSPTPHDGAGHGTHTIGTMVGGDGPGPFEPDIGLAYGATFISGRIFDDDYSFELSDAFDGAQWMLDPDGEPSTNDFPHVISNSWGLGVDLAEWPGYHTAILAWRAAGIVPVAAIGNNGPDQATTGAPANYEYVIGVGATTLSDNLCSFSSRGPSPEGEAWPEDRRKPELSAPGQSVPSCVPGGSYESWQGTSMAAPHVTATVALMLQADPGLEFDELRTMMLVSAVDLGDPGYDLGVGYGRLDCFAAVTMVYNGGFLVTGPGPAYDNDSIVRFFTPEQDAAAGNQFSAYGVPHYGVNVSCGDIDGDGLDEILTGAGPGEVFGPHVRGFSVLDSQLPGVSFLAYGTNKYGVNVAAGDLDADGFDEIITGAGPGAVFGPHVRGWNYDGGSTVTPLPGVSYFAYGTPKWGVNVSAGDIDGDGYDEIVTGAGPGAVYGPHVRGWDYDGGSTVTRINGVSYFAYGTLKYGVNVACGDIDGDGIDEIITGAGPGAVFSAHVRGWNVDGGTATAIAGFNFFAWPAEDVRFGANVFSGVDLNGNGRDEIVVGQGPDLDAGSWLKVYMFDDSQEIEWLSLEAFGDLGMTHGVNVAAGHF